MRVEEEHGGLDDFVLFGEGFDAQHRAEDEVIDLCGKGSVVGFILLIRKQFHANKETISC